MEQFMEKEELNFKIQKLQEESNKSIQIDEQHTREYKS